MGTKAGSKAFYRLQTDVEGGKEWALVWNRVVRLARGNEEVYETLEVDTVFRKLHRKAVLATNPHVKMYKIKCALRRVRCIAYLFDFERLTEELDNVNLIGEFDKSKCVEEIKQNEDTTL